MSKRVLNNPEYSESSEASINKRKKLDEERALPLQKYNFTRKCKVFTLLKEFKICRLLTTFPDITTPILWSYSFRLMANDTNNINARIGPTSLVTQSLIFFVLTRIKKVNFATPCVL
ncbi:hypothetical protein BDF21DRAFT_401196 [Thamnidium elegans]|nr:hypothetical protein BDF21DRAFT_401196 [Thamnidium elegans]